jgi:glycosyltransferase involved in cell wall biosynthesis
MGELGRIMMLVPHDPDDDPRIGWVTELCVARRRTEILASTWSTDKQARSYDGTLYVERVNINEQASSLARAIALFLNGLVVLGPAVRYIAREGQLPAAPRSRGMLGWARGQVRSAVATLDHQLGAIFRFTSALAYYNLIVSALFQRARGTSVRPAVLVCHDIYALVTGVMLKGIWRCQLLYDSHEFWGDADMIAQRWEKRFAVWFERRFIRKADAVITVSPPLARHLEKIYGIRDVVTCPNAEPLHPLAVTDVRPTESPVKFLLQGQASPRRGIDLVLDAWDDIDPSQAILFVRCPENSYVTRLRELHQPAVRRGSVVFLTPVKEAQLVTAAAFADVGIIPYTPTSLSHTFACPNKLSQYMQAGLAILSSRLEYISEVLKRYECGLTYEATDRSNLREAVWKLTSDPDSVTRMRLNSVAAAQRDFNWTVQSASYGEALDRLLTRAAARA